MKNKKADIDGLTRLYRMVRSSFAYFGKKYDLSVYEMGIIFDTYAEGQITVTALTNNSEIPKSTVSRTVDKLVQRGYLNRIRPDDNRRIVQISITDSFRTELEKLKDDEDFQNVLKQDLPPCKAQEAIEKYMELVELLRKDG